MANLLDASQGVDKHASPLSCLTPVLQFSPPPYSSAGSCFCCTRLGLLLLDSSPGLARSSSLHGNFMMQSFNQIMDLGIAGLALFTKKGSDCCLLYTIFPGTQQAETLALP